MRFHLIFMIVFVSGFEDFVLARGPNMNVPLTRGLRESVTEYPDYNANPDVDEKYEYTPINVDVRKPKAMNNSFEPANELKYGVVVPKETPEIPLQVDVRGINRVRLYDRNLRLDRDEENDSSKNEPFISVPEAIELTICGFMTLFVMLILVVIVYKFFIARPAQHNYPSFTSYVPTVYKSASESDESVKRALVAAIPPITAPTNTPVMSQPVAGIPLANLNNDGTESTDVNNNQRSLPAIPIHESSV